MNFVIVSPRGNAGGVIVLHTLCKYLSDEGHNAKILYIKKANCKPGQRLRWLLGWLNWMLTEELPKLAIIKLFGSWLTNKYPTHFDQKYCNINYPYCERIWFPFVGKNSIVVYPEIVYGNPLGAKNVVRWFLYHNRFPDDKDAYGANDLFFCFRKVFNDVKLNPTQKTLTTPFFNLELYKRTNFGKRHGNCYIIRKGKNRIDLPQKFDGIVIDDLPEAEKVRIMNESKYCISYDMQTAYSSIAALCGCISVIVPEPGKTLEDYRTKGDNMDGIAFGFAQEEIKQAIRTAPNVLSRVQRINFDSKASAKNFAKECKIYFKM